MRPASDQAEPESKTGAQATRMVGFENRGGAYLKYVSTGSAEARRLQAGLI
jgi:hypothetical protein